MGDKGEKTNPFERQWELLQALKAREEDQAQQLLAKTELNPALIKEQLLEWLQQFPVPKGSIDDSWESSIRDYTVDDDSIPREIIDLGVLFTVPLYTLRERYLLLIKSCAQPDIKGMGIISVAIDRKTASLKMHAKLANTYHTEGKPEPLAIHTVWIENFHQDNMKPVLDNCGLAIFGNELISRLAAEKDPGAISGSPDSIAWARSLKLASEEQELIQRFRDLNPDVRSALFTILLDHHAAEKAST